MIPKELFLQIYLDNICKVYNTGIREHTLRTAPGPIIDIHCTLLCGTTLLERCKIFLED